MKALFRSLKIKTKLHLILGVIITSLVIVQIISCNELWNDLNNSKKTQIKELSQIAYSIILRQEQLVLNGKLTQSQAKTAAKSLIENLSYGSNNYFFIFDDQYRMVMHPVKLSLNGAYLKHIKDANGYNFLNDMISQSIAKGESYVNYVWPRPGSEDSVNKLSYAVYYPKWGWGVGTGAYMDDIIPQFQSEVIHMMKINAVIITLAILIVLYTSDSIITPLIELEHKMHDVTEHKDLTLRSNIGGHDEIADMSYTFDTMLEAFHNILASMSLASEQISCASTALSGNTSQTLIAMETQKSETHQVATAMNQMSTTVHQVANNISDVASASHGAAKASSTCRAVLKSSDESIQNLSEKIGKAEELIHTLELQSSDISSILSVITAIAEQTNLLALNAAIEAARAGDTGKGFAVVADEVRSLSTRTHESTNDIHNVIQNLQQCATSAVTAMTESKEAAIIVAARASETDVSLLKITESVTKIDIMTSEIASASEQQTVVAEEINRNINNISVISDESAVTSSHTASASAELANLAKDLKSMASQFKVNDNSLIKSNIAEPFKQVTTKVNLAH